MIVCVCHNVSDHKIRRAVEDGVSSMAELRRELSVGTCCGKCHSCAKSVLKEALSETSAGSMSFGLGVTAIPA